MAKRRRQEIEDEIGDFGDTHSEEPEPEPNSDLQEVVNQVVRFILTRESKGQFIRREHIAKFFSGRRISYETVIKETMLELESIYGLTLVEAPLQSDTNRKKPTKSKPKQPLVLVSSLEAETRSVLGEIWSQAAERVVSNGRNLESDGYFLPKHSKTDTPSTNQELVKTGLMVLVVSLIILSENHLSELDLVKALRSFGISSSLVDRNSNYHLNSTEYLEELAKKEYIVKETNESATNYSLGRRALVEFTPHSVFEYVKRVYGEDFSNTIAEQTLITIERAYGEAIEMTQVAGTSEAVSEREESVTASDV